MASEVSFPRLIRPHRVASITSGAAAVITFFVTHDNTINQYKLDLTTGQFSGPSPLIPAGEFSGGNQVATAAWDDGPQEALVSDALHLRRYH